MTTERPAKTGTGDPEDLSDLYDRYAAEMYAYACLLAKSKTEAEDVVQESFLRLARSPGLAEVEDLRSYLLRVVRNEALRQVTRWARWRARDQAKGTISVQEAASAQPETRERAEALQRAMAQLPPDQREVVFLKIWQEMTFAAIGDVMGISPNTAASRYRYGVSKLREMLDHDA